MDENNLGLEDFVSDALSQIVHGVYKAQGKITDTNAVIQPTRLGGFLDDLGIPFQEGRGLVSMVEFDVALTVIEADEVGGRIGVLFANIGASADGRAKDEYSSAHRVRFSIPVLFSGEKAY